MEFHSHEGKDLRYVTVHPDGYDASRKYPLIVMLHGFGADMMDLANLAPSINNDGYLYVFPNAPLVFEIRPGQTGFGWTKPLGLGEAEDIRNITVIIQDFVEEVMGIYNIVPGQVILGGFSQGGSMTYRCGLIRPDMFAALVALSSTLPDDVEIESNLPMQRTQPIFIGHGQKDPMISLESALSTKGRLESAGYKPYYREYPIGHEIKQEVLDDLVPWIKSILPPLTPLSD
jgi:phospholipase/carboxylesterase